MGHIFATCLITVASPQKKFFTHSEPFVVGINKITFGIIAVFKWHCHFKQATFKACYFPEKFKHKKCIICS
jgi:hypothetical protein